uniref:Small ribosomal subunit protein bS6m n=1 Tax=Timema bartmani TaxID=61472 RepID=A0A7R9EPJ1_9NEOP|nr:unnamed protein product [Timema bartmani]
MLVYVLTRLLCGNTYSMDGIEEDLTANDLPHFKYVSIKSVNPEVVSTLKRTSEAIFETGGFIRQLENLGTREIPYKTSAHGQVHKKASYFLLRFDCPPKHLYDLSEGYGRDVDIVRHRMYKVKDPEQFECTIEEETKPPAYRQVIIITLLFPSLVCEEIAVLLWDVITYRSRGASSYRCRLCLAQKDGEALLAPLCTLALILFHSKSVIWHEVVEHPQLFSVVYILRMIAPKYVSE